MRDEKWTEVVTKLNRLTHEGKIKWQTLLPPRNLIAGTDDKITVVYFTEYRRRWIGIFERKFQAFEPETETLFWDSRPVIGIFSGCDRDAALMWEFPSVGTAADDLLESIRFQSVEGKKLLDEFLSEEDE